MDNVYEEKRNDLSIKVFQDDMVESPDHWGEGNLFC
jgi:hypothetical protein